MANDPRQPDWRGAAEGPTRSGPRYGWKPDGATAAPVKTRFLKRLGFAVAGGAVFGLIVALVQLLAPPERASLVLVGADPAVDLERLDVPLDLYGWLGGRQLAGWAASDANASRWGRLAPAVIGNDPTTPLSLEADQFNEWVAKLAAAKAGPLVVYFGMHTGSSLDGPQLLTAGGGRLAARTVLEAFAGDKFRGRPIVLLFDPARHVPDATLGHVHDDFARGLAELQPVVDGAASKLIVLCGASPGERGWESEEWRSSAFAHAIHDGLRGAAAPPGRTSVSAWDLFAYAKQATADWTGANRPTPQTPLMLPPPDKGGEERAKAMMLVVTPANVTATPPADAPGQAFKAPPALAERWQAHARLDAATPPANVYTPRLWRRYRELLLRYEQLLRAGETTTAERLAATLVRLEKTLDDTRTLAAVGDSRPNALPLTAALGGDDPVRRTDAQEKSFRELWEVRGTEATRNAKLEGLRGPRLTAYLLEKAADPARPAGEFDDAAELLFAASDPAVPRPIESHYLLMVRDFFARQRAIGSVPERPDVNDLRKALAVRRQAEAAALGVVSSAYPYSERVWPFTKGTVEAGDSLRRPGEDLLFCSAKSWGDSRSNTARAGEAYASALKTADVVQRALARRDRALADLPYLTRWAAAKRDDARQAATEDAWAKLHDLDRRLADPGANPGELSVASDALATIYDPLAARYAADARQAADLTDLQANWLAIENVLTAPLTDPTLRGRLVAASRSMSAKFNVERDRPKDAAAPEPEEPARSRALRRAKLALAELGPTVLDTPPAPLEPADAAMLRSLVADWPVQGWEAAAARLGERLARYWQALAAADTERLSRYAVAFAVPATPEPATVERAKRWQALLVDLARRTAIDHWYAENGDAYFRDSAKRTLDDAARLGGDPPGAEAVRSVLAATRLEATGPASIDWTSESARVAEFALRAPPNFPGGGFAALWPQATEPVVVAPEDRGRQAENPIGARRVVHLGVAPTVMGGEASVTLHGYFRGQRFKAVTPVRLDRDPVMIVSRVQPPVEAGFAVRADDDLRLGAIVFVLDFSGSMAYTPDDTRDWKNPQSKFQQALAVLERALANLPTDTPLSVRVFGHVDPPPSAETDPAAREVALARGTPSRQVFKGTVKWTAANPQPLSDLMAQLRAMQPKWYTPLVRSMTEAKDADYPDNYTGPKTMVVLTDGADTTFRPAERVEGVRKQFDAAFAKAGIAVQMVLFRVDPREEDDAKKQFDAIAKMNPPGRLWEARDPVRLAEQLELALRPKVRLLLDGEPAEGVPPSGLPANRASDSLLRLRPSGPLAPKTYDVAMHKTKQPVVFDRGDRLLLRAKRAGDGVAFGRDLFADEFPADRRATAGDWVLCVTQVLDDPTRNARPARLMATVETTVGRWPGRGQPVRQVPPRFQFWELLPDGAPGAATGPVRVSNLPGYPAPAWELVADDWPADPLPRPVVLKCWASAEPPPVGRKVPLTADAIPAAGSYTTSVELDGAEISLAVSFEELPLRTEPGQTTEPPAVPCLVVRARSSDGSMLQTQVPGLPVTGEEHRFYRTLGSYMALYGPVTRDQFAAKEWQLELVPLKRAKAGSAALSLNLPPPRRTELRPQPLRLAVVQ